MSISVFLDYLYATKGSIAICEEFTQVSSYSGSSALGDAAFKQGYITGNTLAYRDVEQSKKNDFKAYLQLVTIPLEILESEPRPLVSIDDRFNPPLEGALNPKRDVNGLVRKKYDILIKYFKEAYGINTSAWQNPSIN